MLQCVAELSHYPLYDLTHTHMQTQNQPHTAHCDDHTSQNGECLHLYGAVLNICICLISALQGIPNIPMFTAAHYFGGRICWTPTGNARRLPYLLNQCHSQCQDILVINFFIFMDFNYLPNEVRKLVHW